MENDMKLIVTGQKGKDAVVKECIEEMKKIFLQVNSKREVMKQFLKEKVKHLAPDQPVAPVLNENRGGSGSPIEDIRSKLERTEFMKCPQCKNSGLKLKQAKTG